MDKTRDLIPVCIYQTKKRIMLVDRPHFNSSKYECQEDLIRWLRLDVSIWFLEHLQTLHSERIAHILKMELDENPYTIYSN